jgi:hypothetical protein
MLEYIVLGFVVFLLLMFIGMNARIGNLELIVANNLKQFEAQVEFNKDVVKYHKDLDKWLETVDKNASK